MRKIQDTGRLIQNQRDFSFFGLRHKNVIYLISIHGLSFVCKTLEFSLFICKMYETTMKGEKMAQNIEGKMLYLRSCEPLKFYDSLLASVNEAMAAGFTVRVMFGGPETDVSRNFEGAEIAKKKGAIVADSIGYWSKMVIQVSGKNPEENFLQQEKIAKRLGDEVLEYV